MARPVDICDLFNDDEVVEFCMYIIIFVVIW
jgi:hypothetical protein